MGRYHIFAYMPILTFADTADTADTRILDERDLHIFYTRSYSFLGPLDPTNSGSVRVLL